MIEVHLQQQIQGFLNTPPIWLHRQFGIQQFNFPKVDTAAFVPVTIPSNIRLGHQMEHVCKQLLEHNEVYDVLLYNLPIREDKKTIGEIDFILKEKHTAQLIHIELAYKFYLIDPDISEPIYQLMGPNRRDMFFTKMEKIKNLQFSLLHREAAITALNKRNIDHSKIQHQACFKAQLFEPYKSNLLGLRPLNPKCIMGYWLRFSDLQDDAFKEHQFYIPYKSQWVIAPNNNVSWTSHYEILMEINIRLLQNNAPMVWIKKSETVFEKFFVVWW